MTPGTLQEDLRVIRSDVAFSSIGFLLVLIAAVGIILYKSRYVMLLWFFFNLKVSIFYFKKYKVYFCVYLSWRISRDGTHLLRFQVCKSKHFLYTFEYKDELLTVVDILFLISAGA